MSRDASLFRFVLIQNLALLLLFVRMWVQVACLPCAITSAAWWASVVVVAARARASYTLAQSPTKHKPLVVFSPHRFSLSVVHEPSLQCHSPLRSTAPPSPCVHHAIHNLSNQRANPSLGFHAVAVVLASVDQECLVVLRCYFLAPAHGAG